MSCQTKPAHPSLLLPAFGAVCSSPSRAAGCGAGAQGCTAVVPAAQAAGRAAAWSVQEGECLLRELLPPWETRACFPISCKPSHPQDAPAASGCTRLFLGSQEGLLTSKLPTSAKFAKNFPKATCSLEQMKNYQQHRTPLHHSLPLQPDL